MNWILRSLILISFFESARSNAQTVTEIAQGDYVAITIPKPTAGDYTKSVILLHAIYDDETIAKNYTIGTLIALRGNGYDRTNVASINTSASYTWTHGSVTSINNSQNSTYPDEQWKLKTVRYNGTLYIALDVPFRPYHHNTGFRFVGWTHSTGAESMKLVSYYDTQQGGSGVLNSEVYNSLTDFTPNNVEYHHYKKSVFSGNVGIGTDLPDAELTVKGNIHAREVKVDMNGAIAPDYVFEKDYPLASLDEVAAYINVHKHLPGVPPGTKMVEDGIHLKEMNLVLLKKIEELTLHLIYQSEEIKRQSETILGQENRIRKLEKE